MVTVLSYNITSPLDTTTSDNFDAVAEGRSSIRQWEKLYGVPGTIAASIFNEDYGSAESTDGCSRLEHYAIASAAQAVADAGIDAANDRTLFILSTTKGNVEWLGNNRYNTERSLPGSSAITIAERLGISSVPIVVDNACISGLSAIITACRMLEAGLYDYAVVCGAEVQSKFIISGFQSLKAMSSLPCRPFDIERNGLNLGEAAATIVLSQKPVVGNPWKIVNGVVRNDAFHISTPSRTGNGAFNALKQAVQGYDTDDIAFINAHGTATLFNDQMESVAIERAGLSHIPVNGFKGIYGHTMGACGVLETILSIESINHGVVLPTKGFAEAGVSGKIHIADKIEPTRKGGFIKMLSGFGGTNAAILASKNAIADKRHARMTPTIKATHHVYISNEKVEVDGKDIEKRSTGKPLLTELYKTCVGNYPRFYKMDMLGRLGFIATELLLKAEGGERFCERQDRAVVLVGHTGSLIADLNYLKSIENPDDYFPSPERFVYTLPNIVTGEIAIRNHYHGETCFYLLHERNEKTIREILSSVFLDSETQSIIGGWINCEDENKFEADLYIIER